MQGRIGIGIVTYNRKDLVRETIECVHRYTTRDDVDFVVADDGSSDGTMAMLRGLGVPAVGGASARPAEHKGALRRLSRAGRVWAGGAPGPACG